VPISILSFQGLLNALITPAANVLVSIGKPKYMSMQATVQAALMVIAVYPVALYYGINGVCVLTTLLSLGVFVYFLVIFSRMFKLGFKEIAGPLTPPLLSGFLTFVVLILFVAVSRSSVILLVGLPFLGAAFYFLALNLLSHGRDVRDIIALVNRSFGRKREP
jgi:O-antigen/teichoic acid export membrane protein